MQDSEKFTWAMITTFVVWALGVAWHPFGYPTPTWHIILWALIAFFGLIHFVLVQKESDESEPEEESKE